MPKAIAPDERAMELQAGAHSARKTVARLVQYDRVENERHLLIRLFDDGAEQERIEQALLEGDKWEAEQLRKLLVRVQAFELHAHLLAGAITELLESRAAARSAPASTSDVAAEAPSGSTADAGAVGASA